MPKFFQYPFAVAGKKTELDNTTTDTVVSYQRGYTDKYEVDPNLGTGGRYLERDKMNQLFFDVTENLQFWQMNCFPYWIDNDGSGKPYSYPKGMVVTKDGVIYYNTIDKNSVAPDVQDSGWITFDISGGGGGGIAIPTGTIWQTVATVAPDGWFMCDGSVFNGDKNPQLADILYALKVNDVYYLPDFRDRYPKGASSITSKSLGKNGDAKVGTHDHYSFVTIPAHDHDRGTMRIQASIDCPYGAFNAPPAHKVSNPECFNTSGTANGRFVGASDGDTYFNKLEFDTDLFKGHVNDGWSGRTSTISEQKISVAYDDPDGIDNDVKNVKVNFMIKGG